MQVHSVRIAALLAAYLFFATPQAHGGECRPAGLASYSNLGRAMAKMRDGTSGELLAIWLLESPNPAECKFVFRVDRLLPGGTITSMTFDAQTLDEMANDDARGWGEYGGSGQSSDTGGAGEGASASGENSGSGSSNSGSGSSDDSSDDSGDDGSDDSSDDSGDDSGDDGGDDGGEAGGDPAPGDPALGD